MLNRISLRIGSEWIQSTGAARTLRAATARIAPRSGTERQSVRHPRVTQPECASGGPSVQPYGQQQTDHQGQSNRPLQHRQPGTAVLSSLLIRAEGVDDRARQKGIII